MWFVRSTTYFHIFKNNLFDQNNKKINQQLTILVKKCTKSIVFHELLRLAVCNKSRSRTWLALFTIKAVVAIHPW